MQYLPLVLVRPNVYAIDDSFEGDAFELSKDEQHHVNQTKARLQYFSELFGTTTKTIYINEHANWTCPMVATTSL